MAGTKWYVPDPEFYGKLPVRTEIEVLPADVAWWCPLCRAFVHESAIADHCRKMGDQNHLALEVMEV